MAARVRCEAKCRARNTGGAVKAGTKGEFGVWEKQGGGDPGNCKAEAQG